MADIRFDEQLFNKQINDCRVNFFKSLSVLLKKYKENRINITSDSQLKLEEAWKGLNGSFTEIQT